MTCETCRYWNASGTGSFGNRFSHEKQIWARPCQRFPKFEARWFDDWCGEYAAKEQNDV